LKLPRLKEVRELHGWSQARLAEESAVSRDSISNYETGQREAWPATAKKLADALDVEIADLIEPARELAVSGKAEAPRGAGRTLADFLNERCGHAYLALGREEIQALFDRLEGVEDEERKRKELGLTINDEYNTFCSFPRNVTREERLAMRSMIRGAISDVAVKHQLALVESGLWPEYQEELKRIFEVERATLSDEETA
jgi:transcriptional regulator with XRE-family HTH domain